MPDIFLGEFGLDITPPVVSGFFPGNGTIDIPNNTDVYFDIADDDEGVDLSSIVVVLEGVTAFQNSAGQNGWGAVVTGTSASYHIVLTPSIYLPIGTLIDCTVDGQDLASPPNVMTTYTSSFTTEYTNPYFGSRINENNEIFLLTDKIKNIPIANASSVFQRKYDKPVSVNNIGNAYPIIESPTNLLTDSTDSVVLKTVESGRLDTNLNAVKVKEVELGVGEIVYYDELSEKGTFLPHKYVIEENSIYYGIDRSLGKVLNSYLGTITNSKRILVCDKDDDYIIVITQKASDWRYSLIPKLGSDATSYYEMTKPVDSPTSIKTIIKVSDNVFIAYYSVSSTYIDFDKLRFNGTVLEIISSGRIELSDYIGLASTIQTMDFVKSEISSTIIYGVISYRDTNVDYVNKTLFITTDDLSTYMPIITPGTVDTLLGIGNPLNDELNFNPHDIYNGDGYKDPKLYYDKVNKQYILTIAGLMKKNVSSPFNSWCRYITMYSNDFVNWNILNYPIFKENVAHIANGDLDVISAPAYAEGCFSRLVRLRDKYFSIAIDVDGVYTSIFNNESELFGLRRGFMFTGDSTTSGKGALITAFDMVEVDGIVYVAFFSEDSLYDGSFNVSVVGNISNMQGLELYNHAYFGNTDAPDGTMYGWAKASTGAPVITPGNEGLLLIGSSGNFVKYSKTTDVGYVGDGIVEKYKFCIKPTGTDASLPSAQGVYFRLKCSVSLQVEFQMKFAANGMYFSDINDAYNEAIPYDFSEFTDILIVYYPNGGSSSLKIYANLFSNSDDNYVLIYSYLFGVGAFTTQEISFGMLTDPLASSQCDWKYFMFADTRTHMDLDLFKTNIGYTGYENIDPIPASINEVEQKIINDLSISWRGLDSYEDDYWTINNSSNFLPSNIVNKSTLHCWRTSITTVDNTLVIDGGESNEDIGFFIFDTIVFYNTNVRLIKLQANTENLWTTPPFEIEIDLTLETGTILADAFRQDEDLLTFRCVGKDWEFGELKDKYVMLERLQTGGGDSYGPGFKILENGPDYIVISTIGLTISVPGTGKVGAGDNFLIYDTKVMHLLDAVEQYRYIRIVIPQVNNFPWDIDTNQPRLRNENSWKIGEFDIGMRVQLSENAYYPNKNEFNIDVKASNYEGQITTYEGEMLKTFELLYELMEDEDFEKLNYLYSLANDKAYPFWYVPAGGDHKDVYLVYFDKDDDNIILPEHRSASFVLKQTK